MNTLKGIDKKINRFPNYFLMRQLLVNGCDETLEYSINIVCNQFY